MNVSTNVKGNASCRPARADAVTAKASSSFRWARKSLQPTSMANPKSTKATGQRAPRSNRF
eukprot:6297344-Prymnesium_polylepis.2